MIALLAALVCPAPELINDTQHPWNANDKQMVIAASDGCINRGSPCLIVFTKWGERDYRALCGEKREE